MPEQSHHYLDNQPWTHEHLAYTERTAIRIAIDVVGLADPHRDHSIPVASYDELCKAARHIGAVGSTRAELLGDLVGIMALHEVEPTPTVVHALGLIALSEPAWP